MSVRERRIQERLTTLKNTQYEAYQAARSEQKEIQTAFANVQSMLGLDKEHTTAKEQKQRGQDIS